MVALPTRDDSGAARLAAGELILAAELEGCLGGFRTPTGEINAAGVADVGRRERAQAGGELLGRFGVELRGVGERQTPRLDRKSVV